MKRDFETSKLYYGFPIFILGYKDEKYGYNITTSSSSYTLGDMMVIGIFSGGNACQQLTRFREFTINIVSEEMLVEMEQAGFNSRRDKLNITGLMYQKGKQVDAPVLEKSLLVLECQVEQIVEYGKYTNFIAHIKNRLVDESVIKDEKFDSDAIHPVLYMGDEKERTYRYLDKGISNKLGSFLKNSRKRGDK